MKEKATFPGKGRRPKMGWLALIPAPVFCRYIFNAGHMAHGSIAFMAWEVNPGPFFLRHFICLLVSLIRLVYPFGQEIF